MDLGQQWPEEEWVPISALEHYSYCPRQCALIHLEQVFDENVYTLRGRAIHERVDTVEATEEEGVHCERALPLWSIRYGLIGRADVVEFRDQVPYPVEYKHGPRRRREHDDLQLCAQTLCLEEMFGVPVPAGAIYHASSRRRREVVFTPLLRDRTLSVVEAVRKLLRSQTLPPPVQDARCRNCSLNDACLPVVIRHQERNAQAYGKLFQIGEERGAGCDSS